jgi:hypothetical protein
VAPLQVVADPFARAPSAAGSINLHPPAVRPAEPVSAPHPGQNGKANGFHGANGVDATVLAPPPSAQPAPAGIASTPQPLTNKVDLRPELEEALVPRRGGLHPMAYAFIAAVTVFSGVAAFVIFTKPAPQIVVVQAPPTGGSAAPAASGESKDEGQGEVGVGEISAASSAGPAARQGPGGTRAKASATPPTPTSAAAVSPIDTSSFGPSVPGPVATATTAPPAGGQLSQGEMNGVVAQNQPRVRRKCWQPALDGQSANGPKNARVTVNITIGASGSVESASASGAERDFPGLASCIGGMVKGWKFPPSGGSTQVTVPFLFAGQ